MDNDTNKETVLYSLNLNPSANSYSITADSSAEMDAPSLLENITSTALATLGETTSTEYAIGILPSPYRLPGIEQPLIGGEKGLAILLDKIFGGYDSTRGDISPEYLVDSADTPVENPYEIRVIGCGHCRDSMPLDGFLSEADHPANHYVSEIPRPMPAESYHIQPRCGE